MAKLTGIIAEHNADLFEEEFFFGQELTDEEIGDILENEGYDESLARQLVELEISPEILNLNLDDIGEIPF